MHSVDDFEEKLQEEYGTIFNNIAYIRERKRKNRGRERENSKNGKIYCLTTSYKKNEGKVEPLSDEFQQTTDKLESQSSEKDTISKRANSKSVHWQMESQREVNLPESESKDSSLYEKVAMDLETVFNRYMAINPNCISESGDLEGEKNPKRTMKIPNENCTERETATLQNEIKYKTVHTKNDTLYIWTADV